MTTIAYRDGVIACDSQVTAGDLIVTKGRNKVRRREGVTLIGCGNENIVDKVFRTWPNVSVGSDEWNAYVIDCEGTWECGSNDGILWKVRMRRGEHGALGSGRCYALGAMDMGASAADAVRIASERDVNTGGKIRAIEVDL